MSQKGTVMAIVNQKGGVDPAQLAKILSDPAMAALIKSLAANIK